MGIKKKSAMQVEKFCLSFVLVLLLPQFNLASPNWFKFMEAAISSLIYKGKASQCLSLHHRKIFFLTMKFMRNIKVHSTPPHMIYIGGWRKISGQCHRCIQSLLFKVKLKQSMRRENIQKTQRTWCVCQANRLAPKLVMKKLEIFHRGDNHGENKHCVAYFEVRKLQDEKTVYTSFCGVYSGFTYYPGNGHLTFGVYKRQFETHFHLNIFFDMVSSSSRKHTIFQRVSKQDILSIIHSHESIFSTQKQICLYKIVVPHMKQIGIFKHQRFFFQRPQHKSISF